MENSNRLIEEIVNEFDDKFGCQMEHKIYHFFLDMFKGGFEKQPTKEEEDKCDSYSKKYVLDLQSYIRSSLEKVRQETLKELESKLPKDTELPVLEETKDELSDMLRNARKYRYIDWHGIGIRNNTLSEVRKIISELKK